MKTIITTVGTSLFENFMSSDVKKLFRKEGVDHPDISQAVEKLKKHDDASTYNPACAEIENTINPAIKNLWLKHVSKNRQGWRFTENVDAPNQYASAEIESIIQIQQEVGQKVKAYLICTDTVLSVLAAELIKTFFNCKDFGGNEYTDIEVVFDQTHEHIAKDLRVSDNDEYQKGFMNLVRITNEVINKEGKTNCYLNITGGYKAIIPVMTLVGQLKEVPLRYLYEDSESSEKPLVKIGKMPLNFDWTKVEAFLQLLDNESLKKGAALKEVVDESDIKRLDEYALIQKSTEKKNDYELSIIGEMLKQIATSNNSPMGQDILGLYMEDKIRNFFNTNEYNKIQYEATSMDLFETPEGKVVTVRSSDNDTEIGDVDIVLKDGEKVILGEVKSYGQTKQNNLEKIIRRLEAYHKLNECYPAEFWWFVQSVDISIGDRIKESNPHYNPVKWYEKRGHNKVRILRHFKEELGKKYSKINFKAFVIELPLVKGDLKVNYSELLKKQLKENDIISINL